MMFQNDSKFPNVPTTGNKHTLDTMSPFVHSHGFDNSGQANNHPFNPSLHNITANISRGSYSPEPPSSSGLDSSVPNLFSASSNTSGSSVSKPGVVTNKHVNPNAVPSTNKKRKSNVRACDACAIRKVKCEAQRPCSHCVSNNLNCTQLRERKKSGPKNLHRKTLDSINSLSEVIESNTGKPTTKRPSLSAQSSSNNITPIKESSNELEDDQLSSASNAPVHAISGAIPSSIPMGATESANATAEYKVTPYNLIENIAMIGDEPIVFELVKPLTVQSLAINYMKLIEFVATNYPNLQHLPNNPFHSELNLMEHHEDSVFLSKLLVVLTVNLITSEILIKLKKQKFRNFIKYPKKNLLFKNFKNYRNLLHFKCIEIFILIEKNSIVPSITPQTGTKAGNYQSLYPLNQYQVYYNLSLSCLHLCNYYHMLNLTNTLNTANSSDNNYGNEAQEHQKLINLRKSIAYFQLINIKASDSAVVVQLYELFEILYTFERYYMVYSSNNYNLNLVRNNDVVIQLDSKRFMKYHNENINNSFNSNFLFEMISSVSESNEMDSATISKIVKFSNFNIRLKDGNTMLSKYSSFSTKIRALRSSDEILEVIKNVFLFKLLITFPLDMEDSRVELKQITADLNYSLTRSNSDLFKLQVSNYQLLPHLLHLLKVLLQVKEEEVSNRMEDQITQATKIEDAQEQQVYVEFSDNLIKHFPFFNNINKLIRSEKLLNSWYLNLTENRTKLNEFKKMYDHKQTLERELIKSQGNIDVSINQLLEELDATKLMIHSSTSSIPNSNMVTTYPSPENHNVKPSSSGFNAEDQDEEDEEDDFFSINPTSRVQRTTPPLNQAKFVSMTSRASSSTSTSSSVSATDATSMSQNTDHVIIPQPMAPTPSAMHPAKHDETPGAMTMSASSYSLFNDFYGAGTSGSLTNLFQFNNTFLGSGGSPLPPPQNLQQQQQQQHNHLQQLQHPPQPLPPPPPTVYGSNLVAPSIREEEVKLTPVANLEHLLPNRDVSRELKDGEYDKSKAKGPARIDEKKPRYGSSRALNCSGEKKKKKKKKKSERYRTPAH
ncbi:hypothetical protein G9P44_000585 [Scheffersomyces stipitis]|nr:hypothetical protein G9P44_000585 [Scheffersomyces stipitis]